MRRQGVILAALSLIMALSASAYAGNGTRAWGTGGGADNTSAEQAFANFTVTEDAIAQTNAIGRDIVNVGRSTSSCGVCTYYSVTGSLNSINGNASSGTNGGSVAAQGNFNN